MLDISINSPNSTIPNTIYWINSRGKTVECPHTDPRLKIVNHLIAYPDGSIKDLIGRHLKFHITPKGYYAVSIGSMGIVKEFSVHRIILYTFSPIWIKNIIYNDIASGENIYQVNHKDGNKINNCISNLEWCTCQENIDHAVKHGLFNKDHSIYKENIRFDYYNNQMTIDEIYKKYSYLSIGLSKDAVINFIKEEK